jgi:uncharacterized membrane protein
MDKRNLITKTITINAPASRIWPIMAGVEQWHTWTMSISRVKRLDSGPFGVGSRVMVFQPRLPPALWKVTEFVPDHHFIWVSANPGLTVTAVHRIEPVRTGCTVTLSVSYEGALAPVAVKLMGKITEKYVGWEAEGLKKASEGDDSRIFSSIPV